MMSRTLWMLCAGACLLRIAFVAWHAHLGWQLRYDPSYYLTLAEHMRHGVYSLFHPLDIPDTTRMPGYPFLLHLLRGDVLVVLGLQVFASAIKVPMVYALARIVGMTDRPALWAAALMAVSPLDILLAGSVLTEALFTTLLLGGVLFALRNERWVSITGASMCFAAAAWVRPNGLVLTVLIAVLLVVMLRRSAVRSVALVAGTLLLVSPWMLRYHRLTGHVGLSDSGTMTAAYFHLPKVFVLAGDPRGKTWRHELHERASATDWTDREATAEFFSALRSDIAMTLRAQPFAWARAQIGTLLRTLVAPGRGHARIYFRDQALMQWMLIGISALLVLVAIAGMVGVFAMWRGSPNAVRLLLLLSLAVVFTGSISTPDARFRDPAMPFLVVIAAWALHQVWGRVRHPEAH
jgi:hypothetical protein